MWQWEQQQHIAQGNLGLSDFGALAMPSMKVTMFVVNLRMRRILGLCHNEVGKTGAAG